MLTEYEARKVIESMKHELHSSPGTVRRCTAGLVILIGIAVMGPWFGPYGGESAGVAQAPQEQQHASRSNNDAREPTEARARAAETVPNVVPVTASTVPEMR